MTLLNNHSQLSLFFLPLLNLHVLSYSAPTVCIYFHLLVLLVGAFSQLQYVEPVVGIAHTGLTYLCNT